MSAKPQFIFAILLIAVGVIAFAYQGITYRTADESIDLGPVTITTERTRTLPLPPIVGAVALVGGVVLLFLNRRKN